ncbi:MAG TPA: serine/threonine-protein kinase, partial [Gemmataceae bacterium]|nr:serine/threonine-protein kinase [Gemmataceae bacterium]
MADGREGFLTVSYRAPSEVGSTQPEEPAKTAVGDTPPSPRLLGDYELLRPLGKGGMGVVYQACQRSANRLVALKIIRPEQLQDLEPQQREPWLRRFRAEGQAAARIAHEHVVTVYEVGEADGQLYYSMRYVEGQNLAQLLKENGPLPERQAAAYLEPVARAVQAVHEQGILHRDIKPANILLDSLDRPLLTDFGLAKLLTDAPNTLATCGPIGTPPYMAPEQTHEGGTITAATDVYGLGATLYHLLTGRPPFQAPQQGETLRLIREEEPVSPRRLNSAVSRDLETICLKCLEKDPARRYSLAQELADELGRCLRHEPIRARPVSKPERLWRWCKRNPWVSSLAAGLVLALLTGAMVSSYLAVRYGTLNGQLEREQQRTQQALGNERTARLAQREMLDDMTSVAIDDSLSRQPKLGKEQATFLKRALAEYERFVRDMGEDETSRAGVAAAYYRVGLIGHRLGLTGQAEQAYRQSARQYAQLVSDFPDVRAYRSLMGKTHNNLGLVLSDLKHLEDAAAEYRQALTIRKRLAAEYPTIHEYRGDMAASLHNIGL